MNGGRHAITPEDWRRRPVWYRLCGRTPVPHKDIYEAERAFGKSEKVVRHTTLRTARGVDHVSTVFLIMDHWLPFDDEEDRSPVLFETMVFGPSGEDGWQFRTTDWARAERNHAAVVAWVLDEPVACAVCTPARDALATSEEGRAALATMPPCPRCEGAGVVRWPTAPCLG